MISLYAIVKVFGMTVMVMGPLPYSFEECERRQDDLIASAAQRFADNPPMVFHGRIVTADDVTYMCLETADRPLVD